MLPVVKLVAPDMILWIFIVIGFTIERRCAAYLLCGQAQVVQKDRTENNRIYSKNPLSKSGFF